MGDGINYMANTVGTHRVRPFVGNACPQMRVAHLFVIQQFTPPRYTIYSYRPTNYAQHKHATTAGHPPDTWQTAGHTLTAV